MGQAEFQTEDPGEAKCKRKIRIPWVWRLEEKKMSMTKSLNIRQRDQLRLKPIRKLVLFQVSASLRKDWPWQWEVESQVWKQQDTGSAVTSPEEMDHGIATRWLTIPVANSPSIEAITDQAENNVPVQSVNSSPAPGLVWVMSVLWQPKVRYLTIFQSLSMIHWAPF